MTYDNQYQDSISTVQLSPFAEEQWSRIVTYSPIYVHWTDMLMMSQQRTNKLSSGKLNLIDRIDLNTMKLEDEILLNELHHIRRAATIPSKGRVINHEMRVLNEEAPSLMEDYQTSSDCFNDGTESKKHHCSYVESAVAQQQPYQAKQSAVTNQTNVPPVNGHNQASKLPNINLGSKPQPSLGVQLRQSAIARERVLSATHDRRAATPLSISTSKRTISSAHSSHYHPPQQQRTLQSSLSNEINSANNDTNEQSKRELSAHSTRKTRARSTNSSRSTMHMLKTKNDRTRQKQNIELKTLLVEPWKQTLGGNGILNETIPNSLEIMNKMCGPATPFERNLRYNFRKQFKTISKWFNAYLEMSLMVLPRQTVSIDCNPFF